jgi:tRNA-specific 2-thiouridylase
MTTRKPKVLVAMSGGVDSSVAAALLLREGYEVVGCFMRLGSPGESLDELQRFDPDGAACDPAKLKIGHQGCCSISDAADARLVAAHLDVPFYVCNFKKDFGRIIDYFVDEYVAGRTPNPCVRCNDWLKFGKLHDYAKQIDADFVASGHYARIGHSNEPRAQARGHRLLRGVDHSKDQSYVLFGAPRERLAEMLLPIGSLEKPRVREMARELGLPVFDKPDSQEICFVPDNDYAGLIERRRPGAMREGAIVDTAGNVVGAHDGQHRFTIGQRRGLSISLGHPVYVVGKDPSSNTVMVGEKSALECGECMVAEANWLADPPPSGEWRPVLAKIRYGAEPVRAEVRVSAESDGATHSGRRGTFEVRFDEPQHAVTPGQALVCYDAADPDWLIAGGWIHRA